jgi:hypothetical protein
MESEMSDDPKDDDIVDDELADKISKLADAIQEALEEEFEGEIEIDDELFTDRAAALEYVKQIAREMAELGETGTIYACQGAPLCDFRPDEFNEESQAHQENCPYCTKIVIGTDGSEMITEPSKQ